MASYVKPLLLAAIAMSVVQTVAQGQNTNQVIHGHDIGLQSFCVLGEPLSATETLDYEPTDGASDSVPVHREATLYRDSEGRARTEFKSPGQPIGVTLQDCVSHSIYNWIGDTVWSCGKMNNIATVTGNTAAPLRPNEQVVVMDGVETRHSRLVREKEGKVELIYEHWYAPGVHLDLLQVSYGGDFGRTTARIFNLKFAEPDAALFQVPDPEGFKSRSPGCPTQPAPSPSP